MSITDPTTPVEYREIPESEGYAFGSDGSVWSFWGKGYRKPQDVARPLALRRMRSGHYDVSVKINGVMVQTCVHRLICWAFHGPCPDGMECRHLDGNPANNRPDNLAWGTRKENQDDSVRHGTRVRGETVGLAKLDADRVREIRRLHSNGIGPRELGRRFGVAHCTIRLIVNRETWVHVE